MISPKFLWNLKHLILFCSMCCEFACLFSKNKQIQSSKRSKNIMRYSLSILLSLLLIMLILATKVITLSSSCQAESCGSIKIPYPFGIQEGCYLNEWYKIECRNATFPFLSKMGNEVVNISLPHDGYVAYGSSPKAYGSVRVKRPIISVGCSRDERESGSSILNLTDSPFFIGSENSLVAFGCSSKASFTNIEPNIVGCLLTCTASKETLPIKNVPFFDKSRCSASNTLPYADAQECTNSEREEERSCDGNGCCRASLPGDSNAHQVIGVSLESFDHGNSTSRKCRVTFLTDEVYMSTNATEPERFFAKGYATVRMGWVIQMQNLPFVDSLFCKDAKEYKNLSYKYQTRISCVCNNITISGTDYANCGCNNGYTGNPYLSNGCEDINECELRKPCDNCVNVPGTYHCVRHKTGTIMIVLGASFGALLFLLGGIWLLRKFLKKRKMREVFTELVKISSSPEVNIENDDGDDDEEGMNMVERPLVSSLRHH